jgi:hypothetical protein
MSDVNLLVFGCAVSFIASAGAYAYIRERFTSSEQPERVELAETKPVQPVFRKVA